MSLFTLPVPLPENEPEASGMDSALAEALRQRQAQQDAARTGLQAALARQQKQAGGLKALSLITSMGQNPLLQGLQRETARQGAGMESMAANTEAQLGQVSGGIDPLGLARLQQAGLKLQQDEALARAKLQQAKELADVKAEAARQKAAAGAAAAAKKNADKLAAAEAKLTGATRKEFEGLQTVKDYRASDIAFSKVVNAAADPSPANDMSLVYAVMKTFDPSTGVKEGEYATAKNTGNVPESIWNTYNKALSGEFLSPRQREDFVRAAKGQRDAYRKAYEAQAIRYASLVPAGDAEKVIGEPVPQPPASTGPARTPATQAMPANAAGNLLLEPRAPAARTPKQEAALKWARDPKNKADPRAAEILRVLGESP